MARGAGVSGNGGELVGARAQGVVRAAAIIATATASLVGSLAYAQPVASAYTTGYRWDAMRRLVGQIQPDPDDTGPLQFPAMRYTYDADGQLTVVERGVLAAWQPESVAPASWSGFTVLERIDNAFDAVGNNTQVSLTGSGALQTVTQKSYDQDDRLDCNAVRMNPAAFGSLPASACTLGTAGTFGADRITKNVYDAAGQLRQVKRALGTPREQTYATYTYSNNGQRLSVQDANNNLTKFGYDGFDRLLYTYFLDPANGTFCSPGSSISNPGCSGNQTYEKYGYDGNDNRMQFRTRNAQTINFTFDALNRQTVKDFADNVAANARDVYSAYDLLSRPLSVRFDSATGPGIVNTFDRVFLRTTTNSGITNSPALGYDYDANGNRQRVTYPDGNFIQYTFDGVNRMKEVRENGASSGIGLLAVYTYDNLGRRGGITRGNGTASSYGYDGASRLASLTQDTAGTGQDLSLSFLYNPGSQIVTRGSSNDPPYKWTAALGSRAYTANGLNQYSSVGGTTYGYDANGNLTGDGTRTFAYDALNRLKTVTGGAGLALDYDPTGRLQQTTSASVATQYLYDGDRLTAEYNSSGTLLRRYAHGAGLDEPLVWFEGTGLIDRRWLNKDERGSVISQSDGAGNAATTYQYGPYGEQNAWSGSRFRYTGQIALTEVGLYHYKSRVYDPVLGRFLQTDPIGYEGDTNFYAYVANDPLNAADPTGLLCVGENTDLVCDTQKEVVEHIQQNLPDDARKREFGGYIMSQSTEEYSKSAEGSDIKGDDAGKVYSYTQIEGGQQWVNLGTPPQNAVAGWHSHPSQVLFNGVWEDAGPGANFFSFSEVVTPTGPGNPYSAFEGDIAWVYQKKTPLYLIAPNGEIKLASPREILPVLDQAPGQRPMPALRYRGVP